MFFEDLWNIIQEGGTLGIVNFSLLAAFFWAWKNWWKQGDIVNEKKMLISFATPILIVNGAYHLGVLMDGWEWVLDTWWQAMKVAGIEALGALGLRGGLEMVEKKMTGGGEL